MTRRAAIGGLIAALLLVSLATCGRDAPRGMRPGGAAPPAEAAPPSTRAEDPSEAAAPVAMLPVEDDTAMVTIPAGGWRPFFPGKDDPERVAVGAFELDVTPVTVAAYRRFVARNAAWRKGAVPPQLADAGYLGSWRGPLDPGDEAADAPVREVSWFAARAYCAAAGKRLPTQAEWERAAGASETAADGRDDPAHNAKILAWYGKPASERPRRVGTLPPNHFGVRDLHGLQWEWVRDFARAMVTGESRADSSLDRGLFCGAGATGSADPRDYAAFMRFAMRSSLGGADTTRSLGFRCARDPDAATESPTALMAEAAEGSIYALGDAFTDHRGQQVRLGGFGGQPVVATLIFTRCQWACPRLLADLQAIEKAAGDPAASGYAFVLVSMDDARDTPEVLGAFAREKGIDRPGWTLLHAPAATVEVYAALLGIRYKRTPSGDFSHSNRIVVLDDEGRVAHRQDGLGGGPEEAAAALRRLGGKP